LSNGTIQLTKLTDLGAAPLHGISCCDGRAARACARPPPRKVGKLLPGRRVPRSDGGRRWWDRRTGPAQFIRP
jgi:hypothetical protein